MNTYYHPLFRHKRKEELGYQQLFEDQNSSIRLSDRTNNIREITRMTSRNSTDQSTHDQGKPWFVIVYAGGDDIPLLSVTSIACDDLNRYKIFAEVTGSRVNRKTLPT